MKRLLNLFLVCISLLFVSCTTDISIKLNKDNSVDIKIAAGSGEAFTKMLMASTGDDGAIDEKQVTYELAKAGFSNVNVKVHGKSDVNITLTDKNCISYLFTSGLLSVKKGKLELNLTTKTLKDYYDSADEQTVTVLDLFLAPVFNDEIMSEKEYLEMVGTFYGESASKEIGNSIISIKIENADNTSTELRLPLANLLTLNK